MVTVGLERKITLEMSSQNLSMFRSLNDLGMYYEYLEGIPCIL